MTREQALRLSMEQLSADAAANDAVRARLALDIAQGQSAATDKSAWSDWQKRQLKRIARS